MQEEKWFYACNVDEMPHNGGVCVMYQDAQIALFYFTHRNEWYATQNLCPHRKQMALSRGMLGTQDGLPKVACPFHKKTFSLENGQCLNDEACPALKVYEVKIDQGKVYINLNVSNPVINNSSKTHV